MQSLHYFLTIVAGWISDRDNASVSYDVISDMDVIYHTITFKRPVLFSEVANQAGWGKVYYATRNVSGSE